MQDVLDSPFRKIVEFMQELALPDALCANVFGPFKKVVECNHPVGGVSPLDPGC